MNKEEVFKPITNYPNYQVSNFGRVISLKYNKERILKQRINGQGYLMVDLHKEGKRKSYPIHQLVMLSFKGIEPNGHNHTIDHINGIKTDNRLDNLEVVTNRENVSRYYSNRKTSSQYTGVSFHKRNKKWISNISINGKNYNLGYFKRELDAKNIYDYIKELNNRNFF